MKTDRILDSKEVRLETISGLSIGPILGDLELAYLKVIKIARQMLRNW